MGAVTRVGVKNAEKSNPMSIITACELTVARLCRLPRQ